MIILIPLGGLGERFKNSGYDKPKPLVNVMGKEIIFWLLDNINLNNVDHIVIPYNKELALYQFEDRLRHRYNKDFIFHQLKQNTRGAAETINITLNELDLPDQPILCLDGDNFYTEDVISLWNGENKIIVFKDNTLNPIYSYIQVDNEVVTDIKEKVKISDFAVSGGYGFESYFGLKKYTQQVIDNNIMEKNEFYTSIVVKQMIDDNQIFKHGIVSKENFVCLGTPMHVRMFCHNYPIIDVKSKRKTDILRICFDLDNTLVTYPKIKGNYSSVEPIDNNIKMVRSLKNMGHTIIIHTARNMKTQNGNVAKVIQNIGRVTFDTLEKFDIPYDEIYFGKPYADFYIDDLAVSGYKNLEKQLGFYNSSVSSRDFNTINTKSVDLVRKESNDLSGEIYWFKNIPDSLKDMFPVMFNSDTHNKWYEMEKVNGITVSKLYLSCDLTLEQFKHILNSINRIHNCDYYDSDVNIYGNYLDKLINRYESYDYSGFNNHEFIFNKIKNKLLEYQNKKMGKKCVIHGDPVLTNVLINQFGKVKLIDMRGQIGDDLTILGDEFYDWAKLYQSLIGYDEIHENMHVECKYKQILIDYFKKYFVEKFGEDHWTYLQYLTTSLLFSLIPLHDNDKCYKYYELIFSLI
jgi:capsule biosynthesis phosphatase